MDKHPDEPSLEGDTVEGGKGGRCILTLTWRQWSFQIGFLRDHNNSESVTQIVNNLYESLGCDKFHQVFSSVWLFDNGSEFSYPREIEKFGVLAFYCDPSSPYQKGCCEVTHEYVRRILPKGTSFDDLDQGFIDYTYSHINSERRKKLNDLSPFEAFSSVVENSQVIMWIWDIECARWCYVMGYESECGPDLIMSLVYNESRDYYEMGDVCENEFDNRHYIYGIYREYAKK
jgi:hypothetical protein